MSQIVHYTQCPVCKSANIQPVLQAKDFTVSQEKFSIWQCADCTLRFTQDVPSADAIVSYYQSAAYISHSDTKKGLINRLYHLVRNYTLSQKKALIVKESSTENGSLLDVGAGTGAFAHTMQKAGWQVTGIEPDVTARNNALSQYQLTLEKPETLVQLGTAQFDVITMWHVLEHVHDLTIYLQTYQRLLQPNGCLIIAVPNYTSYDAHVYNENWAAYDVPRHLYHFSPASMQILVQQFGFTIKKKKPMLFDSFYVSMLSEQYKNGKANLLQACWNGLQSNLKAGKDAAHCSSIIYVIKKS